MVDAGKAASEGNFSSAADIVKDKAVEKVKDKVTQKLTGSKKTDKGSGDFRGGPHSQTSKPANDGKDSHHMPARDVSGLDEQKGPAIQMDPHDHKKTSSNGSNAGNTEYREMIGDMIEGGDMRGAMATEIRDVRRASAEGSGDSTKYNGAMREMMEYSKKEGYVPDNPKRKK